MAKGCPGRQLSSPLHSCHALVMVGFLVLGGCSIARRELPPRAIQVGTASWYGPGFHGLPTSSGEIYNQNDLTAAHPSLPLGTRAIVTNLANGKSVEVRINDRGPFVGRRTIDLSYAAARAIDLVGPGTAHVEIEALSGESGKFPSVTYAVQVGAFADHENAAQLIMALKTRYADVYISPLQGPSRRYYRVRLGPFAARSEAERRAREALRQGFPAIVMEDAPL